MLKDQQNAIGLVLVLVLSIIAISSFPVAATGVKKQNQVINSGCRTISSPGVYEITRDIKFGGKEPCIEIYAGMDDPFERPGQIILEGNGHTIRGFLTTFNTAIQVKGTTPGGGIPLRQHSVIIRNVRISGVPTGIKAISNNVEIRSSTIIDAQTGIEIGSTAAKVRNNKVIDNAIAYSSQGIVAFNNRQSDISFNSVMSLKRGSGTGIALSGGSENTLNENTVLRGHYGIRLDQSHGNDLIRNTANKNSNAGLRLFQSTNNLIESNTANFNDIGISVAGASTNSDLQRNVANENRIGISLSGSSGTDLIDNILCRNSEQPISSTPNSTPATETGTITDC